MARTSEPGEDAEARAGRRARWLAAAFRDAYDLSWVPESLVANLVGVHVDREHQAVMLVLRSGTRIVDRLDRVDIVGTADDVAVGELVEAVRRRGWMSVEVHGSPGFRKAVAARLRALEPPVKVAGDVPPPTASSVRSPAFAH